MMVTMWTQLIKFMTVALSEMWISVLWEASRITARNTRMLTLAKYVTSGTMNTTSLSQETQLSSASLARTLQIILKE